MTGKNPFAGWQQAKQDKREALVREFLDYLKRSRVRCQYVTDLADMVSRHITEREGRSCNRATLLRNKRYKVLLLSYMAQSMAEGSDAVDRASIKDPKAKALVLTAELGSENLRREVARLKAYIQHIEAADSKRNLNDAAMNHRANRDAELEALRMNYVRTCQALLAVLKQFDKLFRVDADAKRILDVTTRPATIVVDEPIAAAFFEWMHLNRDVGGRA